MEFDRNLGIQNIILEGESGDALKLEDAYRKRANLEIGMEIWLMI